MHIPQLLLSALLGTVLPAGNGTPPPYRTATVTSYCSQCSGPVDAVGIPLRTGIAAADTHLHRGKAPSGALHVNGDRWRWYWHGDTIQFGAPLNCTLVVRDTGDSIRGRGRFDVCRGTVTACTCDAWGRQCVQYRALAAQSAQHSGLHQRKPGGPHL